MDAVTMTLYSGLKPWIEIRLLLILMMYLSLKLLVKYFFSKDWFTIKFYCEIDELIHQSLELCIIFLSLQKLRVIFTTMNKQRAITENNITIKYNVVQRKSSVRPRDNGIITLLNKWENILLAHVVMINMISIIDLKLRIWYVKYENYRRPQLFSSRKILLIYSVIFFSWV